MEDSNEHTREFDYGAVSMEKEHSSHFGLLNDLKAAVRSGADHNVVHALLNELVDHTSLHFLSEQLAMRLHAYEAYESHLKEHQRLQAEVENLKRNLETGTATDKKRLIDALCGWLQIHIQTADKALADYLSRRARPSLEES